MAMMTAMLVFTPASAETATQGLPEPTKLFNELVALLVVVVLLESAMATIFQWRVYRMLFNARAVKTIFMVVAGWFVVTLFDYDIFARILSLAGVAPAEAVGDTVKIRTSGFSAFMSALVLAGGSAGVNHLMRQFGFRSPIVDENAPPPLMEDEAWLSITVVRRAAVGAVEVRLDEIPAAPEELPALLGVLDDRSALSKVFGMLFASPGRIPSYGGRKVKVGQDYRIAVAGRRKPAGNASGEIEPFEEDVYVGRFASRAVIDFVVRI
jgi:hypothetical protein